MQLRSIQLLLDRPLAAWRDRAFVWVPGGSGAANLSTIKLIIYAHFCPGGAAWMPRTDADTNEEDEREVANR